MILLRPDAVRTIRRKPRASGDDPTTYTMEVHFEV